MRSVLSARRALLGLLLAVAALTPEAWTDQPARISRQADALRIDLPNDARLEFALQGNRLLGLRTARAAGMDLTHPATLLRPLLADDTWEQPRPWVVTEMLLTDVSADKDGRVVLTCSLRASRSEQAIKAVYLWAGNAEKALGAAITPELARARQKARAATTALNAAADRVPEVAKLLAEIEQLEARFEKGKREGSRRLGLVRRDLRRARARLPALRQSAWPGLAEQNATLAGALRDVRAFQALRDQRALAVGQIHRDYFGSAMFRLPAEANRRPSLVALAAAADAFDAGTLRWVIQPVTLNVAGWTYRGWKHHYRIELADGLTTRFVRESGTWELGGSAVGTTVVALRYRGLGGVDETFGQGPGGGIDRNFTTTEIIPGAAGDGPVISPVVPAGEKRTDRGYGIAHRNSPWISRMIRGAGSAMFEFQHRPEGVLVSLPDRLGDLRAVTEAFTGDEAISQINEEAFARDGRLETTPQFYLALAAPADAPFAAHERNTRWQEMDQYTRRRVSRELGFVQAEPLPGVGLNLDTAWERRLRTLTDRMDRYAGMGLRMILVHQPGWMNGRGLKESKEPQFQRLAVGGGDCSIYDYVPRPSVAAEWKALTRELAENKVAYIVWSSYFSVGPGAFIQELIEKHGMTRADFAGYENPDAMVSDKDFFARLNVPHNPNNETIRKAYVQRIQRARDAYGLHGIWADSWHKWALVVGNGPRRKPSFRAWMEQFARWSRQGMAFVSEGQGCPILNCSIELSGQEFRDEWWFLPQTTLWYRGKAEPPGAGTVKADRHTFRLMANKCWPYVETGWGQEPTEIIPGLSRLAREYNAALPQMRRSFVLPDAAGVLWLGYGSDTEGVWFPFGVSPVPDGVRATRILDGQAIAGNAAAFRTVRVGAKDLLAAFGLRRGDAPDPRLNWTYRPIQYTWPAWADPD